MIVVSKLEVKSLNEALICVTECQLEYIQYTIKPVHLKSMNVGCRNWEAMKISIVKQSSDLKI